MEVVVKVEKLDDDDFENITMEEAQLCEALEYSFKKSISKVEEDDTSILSENIKSNLSLSEGIQPTPTVKPVSTNYAESSTTVQSNERIYSPPFYKIIQEIIPDKDIFLVRCCNCGRLMKGGNPHTSNVLEHMKKYHPDAAKLYGKYKLEKFGKIKNLDVTNNIVRTDDNSGLVPPKSVSSSVVEENFAVLSAENLKILEDLISERVQELVEDTGFKELNNKVNNLFKMKTKNDTECATTIKALESKIWKLERECYSLSKTVSNSEKSKGALERQLKILENRLQQRKIIVKNIKIFNREQPIQEVEEYFRERLNLYNIGIIGCDVLPRSKTSIPNTETLLVELSNAEDCKLVVSKMGRIKEDDPFIQHALSPSERKCLEKLNMVRKELLSRNSDLNVIIRGRFLFINKKKFHWDESNGLCPDFLPCVDTYHFTCAEHVENITGVDLKEFLNILHKYDVE